MITAENVENVDNVDLAENILRQPKGKYGLGLSDKGRLTSGTEQHSPK